MNYFASASAAERYAKGRPYFHPLVVERLRPICCPTARLRSALDVGCGTGQSALALTGIADHVTASDSSAEMLTHATSHARISYVQAPAERLPSGADSIDLLTVGSAIHWFDRPSFLAEAARVVKIGGWLAVYNDGFSGTMRDNEDYERWNRERYLARFPTPPRNNQPLTNGELERFGFASVLEEGFAHPVEFGPTELVDYLMTQSNVIAAIEQRGEAVEAVGDWLITEIKPLFDTARGAFPFYCMLNVFERMR